MNSANARKLLEIARKDPQQFWSDTAKLSVWSKPWTETLDQSENPINKWFVGGEANVCYNLVDRHVEEGHGDKIAAIIESSATNSSGKITYHELLNQVSRFAGALKKLNVVKGDLVFIYMPNILELTVAILATWRIGGTVLTLLPNTTANALADRIEMSKPRILVTSNATRIKGDLVFFKKPLDEALDKLNYKSQVIVFQRKEFEPAEMDPNRDVLWEDVIQTATEDFQCVATDSQQAALVVCSSGTTGKPKGIVYNTGGFLTLLCTRLVYEKREIFPRLDVMFVPSHPGWMTGIHGIISPMITGACGVIYDGDASGNGDVNNFYQIIDNHKPAWVMFNAATLRELRLVDPEGVRAAKFDFSSIRLLSTGAEVLDQLSRKWAEMVFSCTLMDSWGQTEGPNAVESLLLLQTKELSYKDRHAKYAGIGFSFNIFSEEGEELPVGETGFIAAKLPLPPSVISTLYLDDQLFLKEYFSLCPGYFNTKDLGWMDGNGGLHVVGRGDDLMKVSGVSMTTTEAEEVILRNADIAECAVVSLKHREMYQVPVAFYTIKPGRDVNEERIFEVMKDGMRDNFGPAVIFNFALKVNFIPTTITGKINRKIIQTELQKLITEISHQDDKNKLLDCIWESVANLGMI